MAVRHMDFSRGTVILFLAIYTITIIAFVTVIVASLVVVVATCCDSLATDFTDCRTR